MALKNVKITTEEYKIAGVMVANEDELHVEADGEEKSIRDYLSNFDGSDVEISVKRKIEQPL